MPVLMISFLVLHIDDESERWITNLFGEYGWLLSSNLSVYCMYRSKTQWNKFSQGTPYTLKNYIFLDWFIEVWTILTCWLNCEPPACEALRKV